ncbi:hypothetical protein HZA57_05140, partial [Candidatus Poribacteria bacterium]|nr:hypothetical protein [Candidatus Poribacteria bacterium]
MRLLFEIENNIEFYCFLKAHLPARYSIISQPSTSYYSEWYYDYRVMKGAEVIASYAGSFRELTGSELVTEA